MPTGNAHKVTASADTGVSSPAVEHRTWAGLLGAAHAAYGQEPAVLAAGGWMTYDEVLCAARNVAASLHAMKVPFGARIVLALDNRSEMVVIERALALWGWVRVALSARLHPEEINYIVKDCEAAVVICETHIAAALQCDALVVSVDEHAGTYCSLPALLQGDHEPPALPAITPDDLASLMYTSGTTGRPKGAMNSHGAWFAMSTNMRSILPPTGPGDILLHAAPMSHFSGSVASAYAACGAAIATVAKFDAATILDAARRIGATCLPLVPTMLADIVRDRGNATPVPTLKVLPYGGSSIPASVLIQARELLGDVLLQVYGMSEALIPVSSLAIADHRAGPDESRRLKSAGRVFPGIEVRLAGEVDGVGEIEVRGANVMRGYWNQPEQTGDVLDAEGWYATGDLGTIDGEHFLEIVGRKRDLVISGGFNIYPAEVERVIAQMPDVAEVAVIGMPDQRWGEAVVAIVVPKERASLEPVDIVTHCRAHLAGYKKPTRVEFVPALLKTSTGKVDKRAIRDMLAVANLPDTKDR